MYSIIATIIILFICFLIAPFMTLSFIFFNANWGIIGNILTIIFFVIGFIHMITKFDK